MGGLVTKKVCSCAAILDLLSSTDISGQAVLLATHDPLYKDTAKRIQAMYFLGTPHQGTNSAHYLKMALSLAPSNKSYVNDLLPASPAVQAINDDFRHVCDRLQIWSFFEGKTSAGMWTVTRAEAVIGNKNRPCYR